MRTVCIINSDSIQEGLLSEISTPIEQAISTVIAQANYALTMLFWKIGRRVNENVLQSKLAGYGKQIVVTLSRQLSWSHFFALITLKSQEARLFYARQAAAGQLGIRDLRQIIARKVFERTVIADTQLAPESP